MDILPQAVSLKAMIKDQLLTNVVKFMVPKYRDHFGTMSDSLSNIHGPEIHGHILPEDAGEPQARLLVTPS